MNRLKALSFTAALAGLVATVPAGAAPFSLAANAVAVRSGVGLPVETVQYLGPRYGRPGYYRGRPYYGRGYGYRRGIGTAVGAGVAAGVLGGLAAGALAPPVYAAPVYGYPAYGGPVYAAPAPVYAAPDDGVAYCISRFRSYNPETGTYIGSDGRPRYCP